MINYRLGKKEIKGNAVVGMWILENEDSGLNPRTHGVQSQNTGNMT